MNFALQVSSPVTITVAASHNKFVTHTDAADQSGEQLLPFSLLGGG